VVWDEPINFIQWVPFKPFCTGWELKRLLSVNAKVFGPGLLSTAGPQHRKQRKLVNPVFSAKHLRDIGGLAPDCLLLAVLTFTFSTNH
jgi:cytochrome P450